MDTDRKALAVAPFAFEGVELANERTMSGIGIALKDVAPLLLAARAVLEAADKAKGRKQQIQPTRVRLSIALLRAELETWSGLDD